MQSDQTLSDRSEGQRTSRLAQKYSLRENEILYIWRKRQNLSQKKAAEIFKLDRYTYGLIELGRLDIIENMIKSVEDITDLDYCIALRRRKNWSQDKLSAVMNLSRTWVGYMEAELRNPEKLIKFWLNYND